MKPISKSYAMLFVMLLFLAGASGSGCQQLGLPTADTFNERLAVGYGTVTQVRASATQLLNAKKISSGDAQNVLAQTDNARAGLDIAREVSKTDMSQANNRLVMATTVLTAVQAYLATRQ